jgi:hypothetical protein
VDNYLFSSIYGIELIDLNLIELHPFRNRIKDHGYIVALLQTAFDWI